MSKISIQWVKTAKIGPVIPLGNTYVLIKRPTSNNTEKPDSIIGNFDYICAVNKIRYLYMKKALLTITGLLLTVFAVAKDLSAQDPKYGKGAVPEDENGNVYFQQVVKIPDGMTEDQCYNILMNWAKGRFAMPFAQAGRILNEDASARRFIFHVDQTIVFKSTAFVADESKISYNFSVSVKNGEFTMKMADIKYRYEEGREGGGKIFPAEDWITDKEAYNRKGTKFLKSTGKFRIKTIDLKDLLFQKATDAVSGNI